MTNPATAAKIAAAAAIADFLARKSVTKVAVGTSSGISDRQFFLASRGDISLRGATDDQLIEQRHEIAGCIVNGLGELIAGKDA